MPHTVMFCLKCLVTKMICKVEMHFGFFFSPPPCLLLEEVVFHKTRSFALHSQVFLQANGEVGRLRSLKRVNQNQDAGRCVK